MPVCVWAVTVPPVVFQCRLQKLEFFQCHSSAGLFQLSFSSGVPVYPASNRWVAQWYPSVHWGNQWHSSGIPVYTGPASVHWLRVRVAFIIPRSTKLKGGILVSPCPSRLSARLSVCIVSTVSFTILAGSISYLHILSSNFRRCVAC